MLIRERRPFFWGILLLVSFAIMAITMLQPVFRDSEGVRISSLQFADAVFNSLSKGSSWFVPQVREEIAALPRTDVDLSVRLARPALAPVILRLLTDTGITDSVFSNGNISFRGNFNAVLKAAAEDAALLYDNKGEELASRYGGEQPLRIAQAWWQLLEPAVKELQRMERLQAARVVEMVVKKAIEPGNNFYGLPVARVAENIPLICAMLAFYVLYAIWYGFGIYRLFEGLGLLGPHEARENVAESDI